VTQLGDGEGLRPRRGPLMSFIVYAWDRRRFLIVCALALLVSVALLWLSLLPMGAGYHEVLANLGASFLGVIATVIVLDPLIKGSRAPEELIHSEFPYEQFLNGVCRSARQVRILGAWPYVMDHPWRARFLPALKDAVNRGVRVQILILDPGSKAAEQRARDLAHQFDVSAVIGDVLREFWNLKKELPDSVASCLDIRVYSLLPPARMYRCDSRAISSFFPMGNWEGSDIKHYETNMTSRLAQFVDDQFQLIWQDADTITLSSYFKLDLDIVIPGSDFITWSTQYVVNQEQVFIAGHGIVEELYRLRAIDPQVRLSLVPPGARFDGERLILVPADRSVSNHLQFLFQRKYGPANPLLGNSSIFVVKRARAEEMEEPAA
jgi:hypothetical protein